MPALSLWGSSYNIPDGPSAWQSTNPNDFNATLETANKSNGYLLKPTIRLAKIWNAANGYVYDSYSFEKWITGQFFYLCSNQKDYLFTVFEALSLPTDTQWRKDKVQRAKDLVAKVKQLEADSMPYTAEEEVKKLIPAA